MRPDPDLLTTRAIGRVCATVAGVLVAVIAVCAVTAMVAIRTSRWYVTAAGSGLVVLLISGVSSTEAFQRAFGDRIFETLLGQRSRSSSASWSRGFSRLTAARAQRH